MVSQKAERDVDRDLAQVCNAVPGCCQHRISGTDLFPYCVLDRDYLGSRTKKAQDKTDLLVIRN